MRPPPCTVSRMNEQREALDAVTLTAVYLPDCAFDNSETMLCGSVTSMRCPRRARQSVGRAFEDPEPKAITAARRCRRGPGLDPQRRVFSRDYETYGYATARTPVMPCCAFVVTTLCVSADENADALLREPIEPDRRPQRAPRHHPQNVATLPSKRCSTDAPTSQTAPIGTRSASGPLGKRSNVRASPTPSTNYSTPDKMAPYARSAGMGQELHKSLTIAQRASMHQLQGDDVTLLDKSFEEAVLAIRYGLTPPPLPRQSSGCVCTSEISQNTVCPEGPSSNSCSRRAN